MTFLFLSPFFLFFFFFLPRWNSEICVMNFFHAFYLDFFWVWFFYYTPYGWKATNAMLAYRVRMCWWLTRNDSDLIVYFFRNLFFCIPPLCGWYSRLKRTKKRSHNVRMYIIWGGSIHCELTFSIHLDVSTNAQLCVFFTVAIFFSKKKFFFLNCFPELDKFFIRVHRYYTYLTEKEM